MAPSVRKHDTGVRVRRFAIGAIAFVLIAVIIILDITTGVWNDLVIVSGLAAGLVTFLLTTLVVDRVVARATERRWAPVSRFALSEFLHSIADSERSEVSRGLIVPRTLAEFTATPEDPGLTARLDSLRDQVMRERTLLANALGRWAQFLASNGDNSEVLQHTANLAQLFEEVRDAALEAERDPGATRLAELSRLISAANTTMLALEAELRARIAQEDALNAGRVGLA